MQADVIPASDVDDLKTALQANPADLGVGLYNPSTGEIRVGSFDTVTGRQGHQGLVEALGITNAIEWRGFLVTADGKCVTTSHLNLADGSLTMKPTYEATIRAALTLSGLVR